MLVLLAVVFISYDKAVLATVISEMQEHGDIATSPEGQKAQAVRH